MTRVNVKRRVAAAVGGARTAGVDIARIEIDKDGRVVIIAGEPSGTANASELNPWDTVLTSETKQERAA